MNIVVSLHCFQCAYDLEEFQHASGHLQTFLGTSAFVSVNTSINGKPHEFE